jgi:hypothetical protein
MIKIIWKININNNYYCPSPRESHTAVLYDDHIIVIFGGMNGKERLNDTWILDINNNNSNNFKKVDCKGHSPIGRSLYTANISKNNMYVFSGFTASISTHKGISW